MNKLLLPLMSAGLLLSPLSWGASSPSWTLDASMRRAVEVAPEMKAADAEIGKQQGKLQQAGAWPNPSVELQVDDSLGLEDAAGGYDLTRLAISQPLPLGRLTHQREQAEAALAGAGAQRHQQQLLLEYQVAQRFHALQLAQAKLQLAEQRLQQASRYHRTDHRPADKDPLVRYLSPLEGMRLDIVHQAAEQAVEIAEGEFNEVASHFKALLGIPREQQLQLTALAPVPRPEGLSTLEAALQRHPALQAVRQDIATAQAGIAVAKSQRFADPTLMLFRNEAFLGGRRQDSTGVMLSIQVPLWNQNKGAVSQARFSMYQAQAEMDLRQRELITNLRKSYIHLGHLIAQAEHYRTKLLQPAGKVFMLTRKGFEAGELNILTLIDANNTYFDAQARYLELLEQGWLELAELRKSAGLMLTAKRPMTQFGEEH